jgi:hypothetical protein
MSHATRRKILHSSRILSFRSSTKHWMCSSFTKICLNDGRLNRIPRAAILYVGNYISALFLKLGLQECAKFRLDVQALGSGIRHQCPATILCINRDCRRRYRAWGPKCGNLLTNQAVVTTAVATYFIRCTSSFRR